MWLTISWTFYYSILMTRNWILNQSQWIHIVGGTKTISTVALRQQVEALSHDNGILKRAVAIQHERQKEHDERASESQNLEQILSQYQEQLRM